MTNGDNRAARARVDLRELALTLDDRAVWLLVMVGYVLRRLRRSSSIRQTSRSSSVR